MTIRAKNELTSDGYVKNYDAIPTVNLYSRQISFALEYDDLQKSPEHTRAFEACWSRRNLQRPLFRSELTQTVEWQVDAFSDDVDSGKASQQEGIGQCITRLLAEAYHS
jgi:hypothetical protein